MLNTAQAELIGTFLETFSYGVYIVIFLECVSVLRKRYSDQKPTGLLFLAHIALFVLITMHFATDIYRIMVAFLSNMGKANAPILFFTVQNTAADLLKTWVYVICTLVSDAIILYRCFVVWNNRYFMIAIPTGLFFADIGTSVWSTVALQETVPGDNIMLEAVTYRVKYFYCITLALNLLCTILIAFKIWATQRKVAEAATHRKLYSHVVAIIVESAVIYSLLLAVLIVTAFIHTPAMFILLNMGAPIMGTVFSLVIIRVGQGVSHGDTVVTTQKTLRFGNLNTLSHFSSRHHTAQDGVEIRLDRIVETVSEGNTVMGSGSSKSQKSGDYELDESLA